MNGSTEKMGRDRMIEMLSAFDKELDKPLKIVITGASALIIKDVIQRYSSDIDVLESSLNINSKDIHQKIEKLSLRFSLSENWLNDDAKKTLDLLPKGYELDFIKFKGSFQYLEPYIISTADSVVTKLVYYENIRPWDYKDIQSIQFSDNDKVSIRKKLDFIYSRDPVLSLNIEIELKKIRPDFIETMDDLPYSSVEELALYARQRYSICISDTKKEEWEKDIDSMSSNFQKAVVEIDKMALINLMKKNKNYGIDI